MPKQLYFEGMEIEDYPIRILHKPSELELEVIEQGLGQFTKVYLQKIAVPFLDLMKKFRFRYQDANGQAKKFAAIEKMEHGKNLLKIDWQHFLAIFYHEKNYPIMLENISKAERKLYLEVLRKYFLPKKEVNKIMGKECFDEDKYDLYWFGTAGELKNPLNYYFDTTSGKYETLSDGSEDFTTYIYIDTFRQRILLREFFPNLFNFKKIDSLPEGNGLKQYCNENIVFAKLPLLDSLFNNGLLPYHLSKLTVTEVKKAQSIIAIPDFFDTYPEKKQASLSATLMLNFYTFFRIYDTPQKTKKRPETLIKTIINQGFYFNPYTLSVLLPYIRGIKKSKINSDNFIFVTESIKSLLKIHHEKGWLPIDSLIMNIRTFAYSTDDFFLLIDPIYMDDMNIRNSYDSGTPIHLSNMIEQISEPFVKALLFALSTFGIVEIAYREPQEGDMSYYDGLQYVRLTELGKYALGISDSYTPKVADDNRGPAFELDDQRMLIKVTDSESPFKPILKEFAALVTPSLYRVDYDTFLTGCNKREDVERKIDLFKQYISRILPPIWKHFFDEILSHCAPFYSPSDKYQLLSLRPDDTALAHLILTEPSLRRYVCKAEGYMLLVKSNEMKKFADAMKKFGYLI